MPSVASQVTASINQHRDAKASAAANGNDRNSSSPFEEMLDSAVAAEQPAPSAKDTSPTKAPKQTAAAEGKNTKSRNDAAATDDATPTQASDVERDEAAESEIAEGNEATLADLVSKALTSGAGDAAPPQSPETVEEAASQQKPIADIGLAAFREALASATAPQPEAEHAKDEPHQAEADVKQDADTQLGVITSPVKADAVAAAVVTMTAEAAGDPSQSEAGVPASGGKMTPAVAASLALLEAATTPVQNVAKSQSLAEGLPANAEVADLATEASAPQLEAPKPQADTHKHRVETTAQHSEAPKLQPAVAAASKSEAAAAVEPEAPAPHPSQVDHRHAETADAKPAKAGVSPAEAPAPAKPVEAPQTLQTLPQVSAPIVGAIQSP